MKKENSDFIELRERLKRKTSGYWTKLENEVQFEVFRKMAKEVPAYKKFLVNNKIRHNEIKSFGDLSTIPPITKKNYLNAYKFFDLLIKRNGQVSAVLTSTSGSTGKPIYFARGDDLNLQSAMIHEVFLNSKGFNSSKSTLVVIAFGMGVWIGGLITFQAFEGLRQKGYPLSIITPGINKKEILKIMQDLAPEYDQVILAGYPPFIKDILEALKIAKYDFSSISLKLLFAAEPFTDKFRSHVAKTAKLANPYFDTMNIYGSADLGTMAFETPTSIAIRKIVSKKPKLFSEIFTAIPKTPTLAQYIPEYTCFEEYDGKLLVTGKSALPLHKYEIGDNGGVIQHDDMVKKFAKHGLSLTNELKKCGVYSHNFKLPFVYVYERADFSTTLYGLQVYPEPIREALLSPPFVKFFTGKFTLLTKFDGKQNQYLEINLEVQPNRKVTRAIETELTESIVNELRKNSSEFRELSDYLGTRSHPHLVFWETEDPLYFQPGVKQKWVSK